MIPDPSARCTRAAIPDFSMWATVMDVPEETRTWSLAKFRILFQWRLRRGSWSWWTLVLAWWFWSEFVHLAVPSRSLGQAQVRRPSPIVVTTVLDSIHQISHASIFWTRESVTSKDVSQNSLLENWPIVSCKRRPSWIWTTKLSQIVKLI